MHWLARLAFLLGGLPFLIDGISLERRLLALAAGIFVGVVTSFAATHLDLQKAPPPAPAGKPPEEE